MFTNRAAAFMQGRFTTSIANATTFFRPRAQLVWPAQRMVSNKVFVRGIPVEWDEHEVSSRFSLAGPLQRVHFVKSAQGLKTGKIVIEFTEESTAEQAIARFDNQIVDGLICSVKPFINKQNLAVKDDDARLAKSMLTRRVYLMNLPYEATAREVEALVSQFVPVDQVVIPRDKAGLARGFAFVYLEQASDVVKAIDFVDGRHIQGRQVRAKSSLLESDDSKNPKNDNDFVNATLDDIIAYCHTLRHQLKQALMSPSEVAQDSPIIQALFREVHSRTAKQGVSQRAAMAQMLKELSEPVDTEAFRVHVARLVDRIKQQRKASLVPEGRSQQDFPHIVFEEQFVSALAQSMGMDIATIKALQQGEIGAEDIKFDLLGGIENRV